MDEDNRPAGIKRLEGLSWSPSEVAVSSTQGSKCSSSRHLRLSSLFSPSFLPNSRNGVNVSIKFNVFYSLNDTHTIYVGGGIGWSE